MILLTHSPKKNDIPIKIGVFENFGVAIDRFINYKKDPARNDNDGYEIIALNGMYKCFKIYSKTNKKIFDGYLEIDEITLNELY